MGQAKNKGSLEDRIAKALAEQYRKIDEVRKGLEIPDDAKFCGFLVHIEELDEFLHQIDDQRGITKRAFVKTPDMACRFSTFMDAHKWIRSEKGEKVVGLFDLGEQFLVAQLMD